MAPVSNPRLLFNKIHPAYVPGETTIIDESETIDLKNVPLNGGVLIQTLVLAVDPYQRGRMRDPSIESFVPAFQLGRPINNFGVGVVLRSESPQVHEGDHVYGSLEFQGYSVIHDISQLKVLKNEEKLPWSVYVGAAGMPGQTAYIGWNLYSKAKKGETLFVNSAAGAVGSIVIQLAKADGLKVIATAGSDDKVAFIKKLGADVAFNYKKQETSDALRELGHGIDIFWDNVGGGMLEAAIDAANNHARIINCGAISQLNVQEGYGVRNLGYIVTKRLSLHGFVVLDHFKDWLPEFYDVIPKKIANGEIKYLEQVYRGLKGAEQALGEIIAGKSLGKPVVVMKEAPAA